MITLECPYEPPHTHSFPDDWELAGPTGLDPRGDRRWRGTTYVYLDRQLRVIHLTQTPLCDDQALDEFTKVAGFGPDYDPVYLQVRRPGERDAEVLDWQYDKTTDNLTPLGLKT